ncbi:MAG TPA: hypothetical protein VKK61_10690 [Tepidisphaeraceae bacterium]|nr:hypothetical protein [Tepidisphaeraceae bacterium]
MDELENTGRILNRFGLGVMQWTEFVNLRIYRGNNRDDQKSADAELKTERKALAEDAQQFLRNREKIVDAPHLIVKLR